MSNVNTTHPERSAENVLDNTAVIIPAYNAAAHIVEVIDKTSMVVPKSRIIVVEDGSTDDTLETVKPTGVVLEVHDVNQGKGAALVTGFRRAVSMGQEFVITLDADGQHDPDEIHSFIDHQLSTNADILVGNRMHDKKDMPAIRVFANRFTSMFVSLKAGTSIPDSQNGYRMIRTAILSNFTLETKRYDTESEILIKAAKHGARIGSVPVRTIYGEEVSTVNPVVDTFRFFRMVFKSLFW